MKGKINRRLSRLFHRQNVSLTPGKSLVSFTFDDVPQSACVRGAEIIADKGCRATYYVCGGLQQKEHSLASRFHTAENIVTLFDAGHEIACHGFEHINYQFSSSQKIASDIEKNHRYFSDLGVPSPTSFAFPFGCVDPRVKKLCSQIYTSCRGAQNSINFGKVDLALLKSVHLYSSIVSEEYIKLLLDQLCENGGWLIFLCHGVTDNPSEFDVRPNMLKHALSQTLNRDIDVLTVSAAVENIS